MRIVSISDLHLGRRSSRIEGIESLLPLFEGADVAVINGDGVDFAWVRREEAMRWHRGLVRALRKRVGKVVWVRGNHDLLVDGPILHREGPVVFTHGHALFDVPEGTKTFESAFSASHDHHMEKHSTFRHWGPMVHLAEKFVHHAIPLRLASRIAIGRPAAVDLSLLLSAAGEGVRDVCIGHLHATGHTPRSDADLYVTGAWTGRAAATAFVHDAGRSALHRVIRTARGFLLGPELAPARSRDGAAIAS